MLCLHPYCSSTTFVLEILSTYSQKSYVSLKVDDSYLENKIKNLAIFGERTFFTTAFVVAFLAIPILIAIEIGRDLFEKIKFKAVCLSKKFQEVISICEKL